MKCTFYSMRGRITSRNNEALVPIAATFPTAIHHCVGVQNVITANRLFSQVTFQNHNYPTSLNAYSWRSEKYYKFSTYLRLFTSRSDSQRFSPQNAKRFSIKRKGKEKRGKTIDWEIWFDLKIIYWSWSLFVCLLAFF